MVSLTRDDGIFILDLGSDDNLMTVTSMQRILDSLDSIAEFSGPTALITVATGKSWTTGFDREWIIQREVDGDEVGEIIQFLEEIIGRMIRLPALSVAVVQGHCFAAGAIFAMAHDQRWMRSDRGYFCFPEVDLQIPFTPGISALLQLKLPAATAFEAMLTGRRYGGAEAFEAGIVDRAVSADVLFESALEQAKSLTPLAGKAMLDIRKQLCRPVLNLLGTGLRVNS